MSPPHSTGRIALFINEYDRILRITFVPAVIVLLFLRAPFSLIHPQFWAEDSTIFFDQATRLGIGCLLRPYMGYLHETPRIAAYAASYLPSVYAPAIYAWTAWLVGVGAILLIAGSGVAGRPTLGAIAALAIVFTTHLSQEVFWNIQNVHFVMDAFLLVQLIADPPETSTTAWLRSVFAFLTGVTTPVSAILLPAILFRLWEVRRPKQAWPLGMLAASGLVQALVLLATNSGGTTMQLPSLQTGLEIIGRRIFLEGFVPAGLWPSLNAHAALIAVAGLGTVAAGIVLARTQRLACLLLLGACTLILLAAIARMSASIPRFVDPDDGGYGDRYFFPIRVSIILIFVLIAATESRPARIGAVILLCAVPLASMPSLSAPPQPDRQWSLYAPLIDAKQAVDVPINPWWFGLYHYRPTDK